MQSPRRLLAALALAGGATLFLSSGAMASGDRHPAGHPAAPHTRATATATATGCDVRGAACDPSKTDHDNGVGNNCDPGYGRGNQVKFGPDESAGSCRTSGSSAQTESSRSHPEAAPAQPESSPAPACGVAAAASHRDHESAMGSQHESDVAELRDSHTRVTADTEACTCENESGGVSGVTLTGVTAPAANNTAGTGSVAAAASTAPAATGVGAAPNAATAGATGLVNATTGVPLAATGLPILGGLVGLFMVGLGLVARRRG